MDLGKKIFPVPALNRSQRLHVLGVQADARVQVAGVDREGGHALPVHFARQRPVRHYLSATSGCMQRCMNFCIRSIVHELAPKGCS